MSSIALDDLIKINLNHTPSELKKDSFESIRNCYGHKIGRVVAIDKRDSINAQFGDDVVFLYAKEYIKIVITNDDYETVE